MHLNDRIGLRLAAGASLAALVACGGGSTSSSTPATTSSPAISQQPQDQTKVAGQTATFTVAALGNGTLSYQWQKDGANIPGATAAAYTTPALTASDAGAYACRVTNALNGSQVTVLSSAASLVVNTPPVISAQPASNPAITQGGTVSFSVVAKGNGTLSYQWQKNGLAIPASANASAVKATLVLSNLQPSDAGTYTCAVTATLNGTTTTTSSAPAVLGVGQLPTITTQPQAQQTVVQGAPASFTVVAAPTSGGTLSFQWRKNGVDIPATANASAATPTLTLASAQGTDAGTYSCAVTNTASGTAGVLASTDAVLAVNVPPTVAPISGQTGGQGGSVTFTAVATGNGALSYQWQKNGVDIPGATQAVLTLSNLQVSAADAYDCVVT
ncbi:MAG TPA: immunoglobulin domain-containing protein, partial [Holophagaceae bacterium]|nr:immunoglobulin domain-containing protein [Holophagaceae bacterium]